MTERPVTLAQLRKAAPKGWEVQEFYEGTAAFWRISIFETFEGAEWRICTRLPDRQTARRAALAALRAMRGKS